MSNLAFYETTDIVLAAVLRTQGYKLHEIKLNGNKGIFKFLDVPTEVLSAFDTGSLLVEPVSFNNAIKSLTTAVRRIPRG
jgi:hypothetical protein